MRSYQFKYYIPRKDHFMDNNKIETSFQTSNYKIKLTRIPKKYQYSDYKFICIFEIYNNIDLLITTIKCNEIDIIKILDNFYYSLCNNIETYYFFSNMNTTGNYHGMKLNISKDQFDILYSISILQFDYNIQSILELSKILFRSFSDIYNFLDLIYSTFLVHEIDISNYSGIEDNILSDEFDYQYSSNFD